MEGETIAAVGAESGTVAVLEAPEAPQGAPETPAVVAEPGVDYKAEYEKAKAERDTFEKNLTRQANRSYGLEQELERLKRQPLVTERQEQWQTAKSAEYDEDRVKAIQKVEEIDQQLAAVDQDYQRRVAVAEQTIQSAWNEAYQLGLAVWNQAERKAYPAPGHERDYREFVQLVTQLRPTDLEEPAREIGALFGDVKVRKSVEAKATVEQNKRIKELEEENRLLRERQGFDEAHASGVLNADVRGRASGGGGLSDAEFLRAYNRGDTDDHARAMRLTRG